MADPDTTPSAPARTGSRLLVLTGLSGAGRSTGAKVLEDLGFYVIDNLPPALLRQAVSLNEQQADGRHLAVVLDSRGGIPIAELETYIVEMEQTGIHFTLVFLDSEDDALIRRYEEHRRPHPLGLATLAESIAAERDMMSGLRLRADMYVNTSETNVHQLREWFESHLSALVEDQTMRLGITSFGFKNGTPRDSDLIFDVRFLPNPHWDQRMRFLTGADQSVRDYVLSGPDAHGFLNRIHDLLSFLIPLYQESGRSYVSIGIGCTGGRHRSVAVAEELGRWLADRGYNPTVLHRDVE